MVLVAGPTLTLSLFAGDVSEWPQSAGVQCTGSSWTFPVSGYGHTVSSVPVIQVLSSMTV